MNLIFKTCSTIALGNVRRHGNNSAAYLVAKCKSFFTRKLAKKFIHFINKFASHLPCFKFFKIKLEISHKSRFLLAKILINP